MNKKISKAGKATMEELKEIFSVPNPLGEIRMLSVHPQHGVKVVYGFEPCEGGIWL